MLFRKMLRDIKFNMSQFITIFLMVFLGILVYSGIRSYMDGMAISADIFYTENNLPELVCMGNGFTDDDLKDIKNIEHVNNAERRLTIVGTMEHEEDRKLQMNFIESNEISKFYVFDGIPFDVNKKGLWLDSYYAENNDLKVGDTIKIKYDTETIEEEILGLINVPDHVYDIKDESELFPTHIDYGFCYLSINEFPEHYIKTQIMDQFGIREELLLDIIMPDIDYEDYRVFNYCLIDVDEKENVDFVKSEIQDNIENALAVTNIEDSFSYETYQGEIEEGETYVGVFTGLFLFIAILSVITTMTRVVKKQRIQIGTLKALGFTKAKITAHYVGYGFIISVFASIVGLIVGPLGIGKFFLNMEMSYFEVPNGKAVVASSSFVVALAVVFVISAITYLTCRNELKENAAQTLRTETIKVKEKSLNITTKGIFKNLGFASKWNIRDILRNKIRTVTGIVGIAGCTMLLVCAFGMLDTMNSFIRIQFEELYDFNYKLSLKEDYSDRELKKILGKYGESTSQTLAVEVSKDGKTTSNNIFVDDSKGYVRFLNHNQEFINLRDDGVFITEKLAEVEGYEVGDTISWRVYGENKVYETPIVGFHRDPQNQNIKMTRTYLESLGIEYEPDSVYSKEDLSDVKEIAGVSIIQNIEALETGMSAMLDTMKAVIILLIVVAAILGSVIIYNLGVLSFTEKQYQFATLKVLGFSDSNIRKIYVKQNNWITYVAIIVGIPFGFLMTDFIFKMALSDSYDFSAYIKIISYLYAIIGTLVVSIVVSKVLGKKVNKIDMVTSLKGNE